MITFYVHKNQLYNFLELKEPVELINYIMSNDYFEFRFRSDDVIISYYKNHTTIELNTRKKRWKNLWQRLKRHPKK